MTKPLYKPNFHFMVNVLFHMNLRNGNLIEGLMFLDSNPVKWSAVSEKHLHCSKSRLGPRTTLRMFWKNIINLFVPDPIP